MVTSPKGVKHSMKPEMAYTPLFQSETFGVECITRECIQLGHDEFWYTMSTDYYPQSVVDFYDHLE